jgi:hypothetical protein
MKVPETMGKTLEQIQREFLEEFDVPDFLDAVEFFDREARTQSSQDREPLVGGATAADAEEGAAAAAATTSSPLQVGNEEGSVKSKGKKSK